MHGLTWPINSARIVRQQPPVPSPSPSLSRRVRSRIRSFLFEGPPEDDDFKLHPTTSQALNITQLQKIQQKSEAAGGKCNWQRRKETILSLLRCSLGIFLCCGLPMIALSLSASAVCADSLLSDECVERMVSKLFTLTHHCRSKLSCEVIYPKFTGAFPYNP